MAKNTIYVGGAGRNNCMPNVIEAEADAAITPGTLLEQSATGFAASTKLATNTDQLPLFADKDQQRSRSVTDDWTIDQNMVAILAQSGDILNVLVATGQTLSVGEALVSNGAGLLTAATDVVDDAGGAQHPVAYADEALTTSGTTLVRVRIK